MLEGAPFIGRQGHWRIAAVLKGRLRGSLLSATQRDVNFFDARARADHDFNRFAGATRHPYLDHAAQSKPQRRA